MGVIKGICISEKRGTAKKEVQEAELCVGWGILGDAHGGNWHRQVSLLSFEKIEDFREKGAEVAFGDFGENLIVEGFDLKSFPPGTRFKCGEALLEITQIGKECHSHCEIFHKMGDCIMPREGVFAVVLESGTIHPGDEIEMIPANIYQTIADRNPNSSAVLATVIDGNLKGGRTLWLDGIKRYTNTDFFSSHEKEILNIAGNGILELEGNKVFCEKIGSRKNLVICGAGHVSIPIIELGRKIGFHVTVIEDRPLFANNARRAKADEVICEDFESGLNKVKGSPDTYFVIVTRGHRYDIDCLKMAINKPNAYIGMMGSKRRVRMVKEQLKDTGITSELLDKVHTPIGLSIGAETPEEIAVSIMAEIIQEKNKDRRISIYDKELLDYLTGKKDTKRQGILCTIVDKKGSAPREVGTKMLILEDGTTVGTIGGGCAESEIIQKGKLMLREVEHRPRLEMVDMTAAEAEAVGMVCGGTIQVYMEYCE